MSLADSLLTLIISIFQTFILNILPVNLPLLSLSSFNGYFLSASTSLLTAFNQISVIMPIKLLVSLVITAIFAEIILVGIRGVKYIYAQIRGSGA